LPRFGWIDSNLLGKRSLLLSRATKPVRQMGGTGQRFPGRHEAALFERRSEVERLLVPNDCAGIVLCLEILADQLVERERVRSGDFKSSIQRLGHRDLGYVSGEIVRKDGLKQCRWQTNGLLGGRTISDTPNELKELRRTKNCVRNRRGLD